MFSVLLLAILFPMAANAVREGSNSQDLSCSITNAEGPQKNQPCAFPFKFKGKIYHKCTTVLDPDNKLWCSTRVNKLGKHVGGGGNYGYCDERCTDHQQRSTLTSMEDASAVNFPLEGEVTSILPRAKPSAKPDSKLSHANAERTAAVRNVRRF